MLKGMRLMSLEEDFQRAIERFVIGFDLKDCRACKRP